MFKVKSISWLIVSIFIFFSTGLISKAQVIETDPIVIVPGIVASMRLDTLLNLSPTPTLEGWEFMFGVNHYNQLIQAFEDKSLVRDEDYFIAFYDWRQGNADSARDYLIPVIDEALEHSNTGRVNIIAHSMGGLVARSYIQSDDYRDDVNTLIMLGTPNKGSGDVYTLWEGGKIPVDWGGAQRAILSSYLNILKARSLFTLDEYDLLHLHVPSVGELMPTYDYVYDKTNDSFVVNSDMQERNLFLEVLNLPDNLLTLATRINAQGGVHIIAGEGEPTVGTIPVVPHAESDGKLWVDGKPDPLSPERDDTEGGDNRVLVFSAFLENDFPIPSYKPESLWQSLVRLFTREAHAQGFGFAQQAIFSKHGDLPTTAIPEVFDILGLGAPVLAYQPIPEPEEVLTFWFASPVDVKITAPSGGVVTKDKNTITGAHYDAENDPLGVKFILIENPEPGQYGVELSGLANGDYHMGVGSFSEERDDMKTTENDIAEGEKVVYQVTYNPANAETPTDISEPFPVGGEEEPTPLELLEELQADVDAYHQAGDIKNRNVHKSFVATLRVAHAFLEKDRKLLTILSLAAFKKQVEVYKKDKKKRFITDTAADDLLEQVKKIIELLKN